MAKEDDLTATATLPMGAPALDDSRSLLVFWPGSLLTFELPVLGSVVIGRSDECEIHVAHNSISRRHAELRVTKEGLFVTDLGSANGTRLGGRRLVAGEPRLVFAGALLEVGLASAVVHTAGSAALSAASSDGAPSADDERTMARIGRLVALVARSRISVVILGETGVGKELTAEKLHALSPRAQRPFLRLNCAALPEALLESELFGHERGAFTGAVNTKPGLLESADGGTVFLDEVADLPLATQAKLLRVLENGEVLRLGALTPLSIDVRVVSATNKDLGAMVDAGSFRRDLFYRLNGFTVTLPALRDRVVEIPELARAFVERAARDAHKPVVEIDRGAMQALQSAPWPGNIRQLRNAMDHAFLLCEGKMIEIRHLPADVRSPVAPPNRGVPQERAPLEAANLKGELEALERQRILDALEKSEGNQRKAAELLGISRRTLIGRLDAYRLPRPRKR